MLMTAMGQYCGDRHDRQPIGVRVVRHGAAAGLTVLQQVRRADHPAATPAEYKQVTVLFADVVHSMDIAAAVGAERLREIMAELVDRCCGGGAAVRRHGGQVHRRRDHGGVRCAGCFGRPRVRACLAALGRSGGGQAACRRRSNERDGVELRLRVGLNSGQVIAGEIGSGRFGYTAVGEQVGMAQRMESVAPPGGVMLSASTARLVEGAAVLGELSWCRSRVPMTRCPPGGCWAWRDGHRAGGRAESTLVGGAGRWPRSSGLLDRAIDGHGRGGRRGRPTRHRQEPAGARSRGDWRAAVVSRCSPPSASRMPPRPVPRRGAAAALRSPARAVWTPDRARAGAGRGSRTPTRGPAAAR